MKFNITKTNKGVIQYILPCLVMVSVLVSCTKFLEEKPTANLTSAYNFTTAEEGNALAVAGYRALPAVYTGGGGDYGNQLAGVLEYWTGKAWSGGSHPQLTIYQTNQISGSFIQNFDNYWNNNFAGVKDCNNALQKLKGITEYTADQKSAKIGEVRALRALYYFNLVRYFGDVQLDTVLRSFGESQRPRTSLKKVYDDLIIPDLEFAVNSKLADTYANGQMSKNAARAILADVYLTCAGYPYQEVATAPDKAWCTTGAWSQQTYPVVSNSAKDFLTKAKTNLDYLYGKYTMYSTYAQMRDPANDNKLEAIFQVQFELGISNMNGVIGAYCPSAARCAELTEFGTIIPEPTYVNSFSSADLRAQERQYFYTSDLTLARFDPTQPIVRFSQPHVFKFYDEAGIKSNLGTTLNYSIYRYSDILLMLTEVNWALTQNGVTVPADDVLKGINAVRARAKLPAYTIGQISNLTIFSERAYELIFEQKMLWDQRRSRKCLIDGSGAFGIENFIGHQPAKFNYKFGPRNLLAPISQAEIANNGNCLQNFDYNPKQKGQ